MPSGYRQYSIPSALCWASDQTGRSFIGQSPPASGTAAVLLAHGFAANRPYNAPADLVDWSPIDDRGRHFLLRAAVPFAGRSLPIFEKVHHKEGCPHCEAYLLDALAKILPDNATPILVTDAGFRNPWFRAVEARGWYVVGRVRQPTRYQASGEAWQPVKTLFQQATSEPRTLGPHPDCRKPSVPHPDGALLSIAAGT